MEKPSKRRELISTGIFVVLTTTIAILSIVAKDYTHSIFSFTLRIILPVIWLILFIHRWKAYRSSKEINNSPDMGQ